MTLPKVKADLICTIGEQMRSQEYLGSVEKQMWEENPDLASVCSHSMDTLNAIFSNFEIGEDNEELVIHALGAAQTVGRATYLLMYQALKQQDICDELND